jgi:hypothetical protein
VYDLDLQLYRCFIIYGSSFRAVRLVLVLPVILYIGEVISGVLLLVQVAHSPETIWNSVNLGLPYFALAAACNVAITLTIAIPLLVHRFKLRKAFGRKNEYTEPYTSAIAILVESSAIYAVVAVIFIGFYARNNSASHLFLSTLSQVQVSIFTENLRIKIADDNLKGYCPTACHLKGGNQEGVVIVDCRRSRRGFHKPKPSCPAIASYLDS